MLKFFRRKIGRLWLSISRLLWRNRRPKVVIRRFGKSKSRGRCKGESGNRKSKVFRKDRVGDSVSERPIRIASFNVAMFSLAPAVPKAEQPAAFPSHQGDDYMYRSPVNPKSILKQSPIHAIPHDPPEHVSNLKKFSRPRPKVSINLPDNEISLANRKLLGYVEGEQKDDPSTMTAKSFFNSQVPARSPVSLPFSMANWQYDDYLTSGRNILEILREADADILALQDVKAEEEKAMKPLSDLAAALGMQYVFAESWAPEFGNAVLSKWAIKRWKVHKIADDDDFRNLLKVTIDVPWAGEVNVCCTQLDHLDENWRMRQINAITQSLDCPHLLAGGLNSLERSDYSYERWMDIVKYYEQIGKPTPKVEVMRYLKGKGYADSKYFVGECEPVVIVAKGQNVQGTCKYGTRVDYILTSPDSPFRFVPGSYSVISSKGTSDHHLVKAEIVRVGKSARENAAGGHKDFKQKIVRITSSCSAAGLWQMHTSKLRENSFSKL